jgi:hypothetical protein
MEEFEKALKEFCEFQNITDPAAIASVRETMLAQTSPGLDTLSAKAMAMYGEAMFWKGFKLGRQPIPKIEEVLGYTLMGAYHDSPSGR